MIGVQDGSLLADHADMALLLRAWLRGDGAVGSARTELARYFDLQSPAGAPGVIWTSDTWREPWLQELVADLPDDAAATRTRAAVAALVAGAADVVVTGQQPGFLGGPLYTLYKVAATIVLAEMRTAAGRHTVPLFWSGDDDDDLREALHAIAYDPARGVLVRAAPPSASGGAPAMVGTFGAAAHAPGAARWLAELEGRHGLSRDLAGIWHDAVAGDWSWSRLQRRALLRMFRGSDLLVVSGNDSALHAAAEPFYRRLWERRAAYRKALREAGAELAAAGYGAPLAESSVERFLYLALEGRRQPLPAEHVGPLPDAERLRPGVAARSAVQDWLFCPAGVVGGPGEIAYLSQLARGYPVLDLPRAPLMPRLFAQLGPAGAAGFSDWARSTAGRVQAPAGSDELVPLAESVVAAVRPVLQSALREQADLMPGRADRIAEQLGRRWTRQVRGLLEREQARNAAAHAAEQPAWVRPEGERQERALAAVAAAALWGDELIAAILHASRRHWDAGLDGRWHEFLLAVPQP